MNLQQRKEVLTKLGNYIVSNDTVWEQVKQKAFAENHWFIPEFIDRSAQNISRQFLQPQQLNELAQRYRIPEENLTPRKVGIVMAGNIPMVGFHDLLCVFLSGHIAHVKPSSKDDALMRHVVEKMAAWSPDGNRFLVISEQIRNADAYIATGSNNSSRYFDYYFAKYPSIIRRNRTSVAVLTGQESKEELEQLADDVYLYFGLGCRNVSKIYVPEQYDFLPLLEAFRKYDYLANHHKYKNNYDYNLAVQILNNHYYMTNGSILLVENPSPFSPISQLNYQFYTDPAEVSAQLAGNESIQCVVGKDFTGFGKAQVPQACDFADGVDTLKFLQALNQNQDQAL